MTSFKFVPDYVTELVETVCKAHDLVCVDIRKEGVYSGYFATISDGTDTVEQFIAYDFGLMLQTADRPALLAEKLAEKLPSIAAAKDEPVGETEPEPAKSYADVYPPDVSPFDIPPEDDTAVIEKKPRKRKTSE